MLPESLDAAGGEKVTVNEALWPAGMVRGKVIPLRENPLPLQVALETVTLEPPAVRVPV